MCTSDIISRFLEDLTSRGQEDTTRGGGISENCLRSTLSQTFVLLQVQHLERVLRDLTSRGQDKTQRVKGLSKD
ncbi:hypothetical protein ACHWQZ_G009795 [Mnemiopsis leidyi]